MVQVTLNHGVRVGWVDKGAIVGETFEIGDNGEVRLVAFLLQDGRTSPQDLLMNEDIESTIKAFVSDMKAAM